MLGAGLSLEQAPPYKIPLVYYMVAACYLIVFSLFVFAFGMDIQNRYYYEAIAITHLLTLGFFTHVMMGTLFQMVPVIIGKSYKNVEFRAKVLLLVLNLGTLSFVLSFVLNLKILMHVAILFLALSILYFAFYSFMTIIKTQDKNSTVKTFLSAFVLLVVGVVFGIVLVLQHSGVNTGFNFGSNHVLFMIYGWVLLLFSGVAFKVIPMFYVAREYPLYIKKYFFIVLPFVLVANLVCSIYGFEEGVKLCKVFLALLSLLFASVTIFILKKRKRARSDTTITLWYFAMSNLGLGSLVWIGAVLFDLKLDFAVAALFGIGFIYSLINGMLYKIIPFLTWFHLSSSFIFEAEMNDVIQSMMIKRQIYVFIGSYIFFISALFVKSLILIASILFLLSSSLLLYNLACGFRYHAKMMKKKPTF